MPYTKEHKLQIVDSLLKDAELRYYAKKREMEIMIYRLNKVTGSKNIIIVGDLKQYIQ